MQWLKKQWSERPHVVYLGTLAVLVVLAWFVSLFLYPGPVQTVDKPEITANETDETDENSETEPEDEGLSGIKFYVSNPQQYIQVTLTPEKNSAVTSAVIEPRRYGMGLVLGLSPEYTKSELVFTFPHSKGRYKVSVKPADDWLPTDISGYAYSTHVSMAGVRSDVGEMKLGECTWNKECMTYPVLETVAEDADALKMYVSTAGKNGTETDMYGLWFPLRVQFAEVKPDAGS